MKNGKIETATGDLLASGYSTFTADAGETLRSDAPDGAKVKKPGAASWSRWDGAAWVTATPSLDEYKLWIAAKANAEYTRRVGLGYTYASKTFSLSHSAQINLNGLKHNRARLTFPYRISTLDDADSYELADIADADAIYDAAFDKEWDLMKDCNTCKNNVRNAIDVAAVDATAASYLSGGDP